MMIKLITILTFLFTFNSCNENFTIRFDSSNKDFEKYNIRNEQLEEGLVREYEIIHKEKKIKSYRLLKKVSENRFVEENYNHEFSISSKNYYDIFEYGFVQSEKFKYKKGRKYKVEIIKPFVIPFSSRDSNKTFIQIFEPIKDVCFKTNSKMKYNGKTFLNYNKREIECLVYDFKSTTHFTNKFDKIDETTIRENKVYYGENIGLMKSVSITENDTSTMKLIGIITIDKFERKAQ